MHRRLVAIAAVATVALAACGASAPPPVELAGEIIDTLDVSETVKACMLAELSSYTDNDLEAITNNLESENTDAKSEAQAALRKFEDDLRACT